MRDVANVIVLGALCAAGTEHGWAWVYALWVVFVLAVFVSIAHRGRARQDKEDAE